MELNLTVELVTEANEDAAMLVAALEAELAAHYAAEQQHGLALNAIFRPHIRFFIARLKGAAVGCAGVALFKGFAEAKRMYVATSARGQGVAQALLARLEAETIAANLAVLRLETGNRQMAALRFYENAGFRPCDAFGDYAAMPPQAVSTSIFLEKLLPAEH